MRSLLGKIGWSEAEVPCVQYDPRLRKHWAPVKAKGPPQAFNIDIGYRMPANDDIKGESKAGPQPKMHVRTSAPLALWR